MEGKLRRARRPDGRRDWGEVVKIVVSILKLVEMYVFDLLLRYTQARCLRFLARYENVQAT